MYGQIHDQDSEPTWAFTLAQSIAIYYDTREQVGWPTCINSTATPSRKRDTITV